MKNTNQHQSTFHDIVNKSDFAKFLEWTANQVDESVVGNQQVKDVFVKHTDKVMTKAKKYQKYIQSKYREAQKAGHTANMKITPIENVKDGLKVFLQDKRPEGDGWIWYSNSDTPYYFDGQRASFWMQGEPNLDPLDYLKRMFYNCKAQMGKVLELVDYQYASLTIIHDLQRWQAGYEEIYFYKDDKIKALADKFIDYLCLKRLSYDAVNYIPIETLRKVQGIIGTALECVRIDLDGTKQIDKEKVKTQTRAKNNWKPPKGYIGSQTIIHSTVEELKKRLNLPTQGDETYKIPRSTLEFRQKRDEAIGGELEGKIKKDPRTHEVFYPNKWLKKQFSSYKPRNRKS